MQITVHGFDDWTPTLAEWQDMLDTVQIGANQDCDVTIDGVTKTMKEWRSAGNQPFSDRRLGIIMGFRNLGKTQTWFMNSWGETL